MREKIEKLIEEAESRIQNFGMALWSTNDEDVENRILGQSDEAEFWRDSLQQLLDEIGKEKAE